MDLTFEDDDDEEYETPTFRYQYHVFLSFRGTDTRHTFTHSLYTALDSNGIRTFIDDEGLDRGSEIAPSLLSAIEKSAASIIILSKNYANSKWCLEELAKILECRRMVLPVFYHVDPVDVRRKSGPFEHAFGKHAQREDNDKVLRWQKAFEKVGGLDGYNTKSWEESELIQVLVKRILTQLNTPLGMAKHPVGINSRVEHMMEILGVKSNDILRVVGFHGMAGVGKTTIARAVYDKIATQFEHCSFISNIKTISRRHNGLLYLQNKLISDLFPENASLAGEASTDIATIKTKIHEKRVLIVLDDVDEVGQLDSLVGTRDWLYAGSRIIITTTDKEVLVQPLVDKISEVKALSQTESLQLFSYHAFGKEKPNESFLDLSNSIVECTGQLPLALEVLGAFLFKKRKSDWEDLLGKLKKIHPGDLHNVLKISFDGLDDQVQHIFLDLACFFVDMEMERENVIDILMGCGFNGEIAITVLTSKSLIKIVDGATLWMHDQLRDMGRQIVREESSGYPSRLWDHDEIISVLKDNKAQGKGSIEGIVLNFESSRISNRGGFHVSCPITYLMEKLKNPIMDTKLLAPMLNLRLLQINHVNLKGRFKLVPGELKWLQWKGCPLESLPYDFRPRELSVLDLTESSIKQLWDRRWNGKKVAMKLTVLNLLGCSNLNETPDFSGHPNLEKLILERCTRLTEIHKSVGGLNKLRIFNVNDCSNLVEFPDDVSGLRCLESFTLNGCCKIKKLPEDLRSMMKSLKALLLDKTSLVKLPTSLCLLTKLERLSLNDCMSLKELPSSVGKLGSLRVLSLNGSNLVEIPDSIGCLTNLETLRLMRCTSLIAIPDSIGGLKSLVELFLDGSSVKELPSSIGSLYHLKRLSVTSCKLKGLPGSIGRLSSLVELRLDETLISALPDEIGNLNMLKKLEMKNCESLCSLPNTIGNMLSLKSLALVNTGITELPDSIGLLENLVALNVNKCKHLSRLPSTIGNLKRLRQFLMEETGVVELPEECGQTRNIGEEENPMPAVFPASLPNSVSERPTETFMSSERGVLNCSTDVVFGLFVFIVMKVWIKRIRRKKRDLQFENENIQGVALKGTTAPANSLNPHLI